MPHRSGGRGTFLIDKSYAGCGPIRRASGTNDPEVFAKILRMCDEFEDAGRGPDLLAAIRDGKVRALDLLTSFRKHGVSLKHSPENALILETAVKDWLRKADLAPKTKEDYGYCFAALGRAGATVGELPVLLRRFRETASPRMFNLTRSACQSFLRTTLAEGRYSDLWRQVSVIETKTVRRKKGSPQPPERARAIAEKLGRYGPMWWTLCCTGMGNKEYWFDGWKVLPDRILIHGVKAEHRDRIIPRIVTPVAPMCHEKTFEAALKAAVKELGYGRVTIYDGRRTWAHWLELCRGIPKSRRDAYQGHAPADISALYEEHPVENYLAGDAEALGAFIGGAPALLKVMA